MREDHLKKQVDLLARALGKVLFGLMGVKTGPVLTLDDIAEVARTEGGLDYDVFSLPDGELLAAFKRDRRWTDDNIGALGEVYLEIGSGEEENTRAREEHLGRALLIFEYQNQSTLTYSAVRQNKIHWLKLALGRA
jgi:hypothetical protein